MKNKTPQQMVREFHEAFGLECHDNPTPASTLTTSLRCKLINEETDEVLDELDYAFEPWNNSRDIDPVKLAKELADLAYVVYGTAVSFGIDLDAVITEVHESNMSKLDDDGKPIVREDGKILKSDNYKEPDIYKVLYGNNDER